MRRKIHKCLSFLLAAVLLASLAAPAALAAEGGDTVFVRTAEDLVQLAENCTLVPGENCPPGGGYRPVRHGLHPHPHLWGDL